MKGTERRRPSASLSTKKNYPEVPTWQLYLKGYQLRVSQMSDVPGQAGHAQHLRNVAPRKTHSPQNAHVRVLLGAVIVPSFENTEVRIRLTPPRPKRPEGLSRHAATPSSTPRGALHKCSQFHSNMEAIVRTRLPATQGRQGCDCCEKQNAAQPCRQAITDMVLTVIRYRAMVPTPPFPASHVLFERHLAKSS